MDNPPTSTVIAMTMYLNDKHVYYFLTACADCEEPHFEHELFT